MPSESEARAKGGGRSTTSTGVPISLGARVSDDEITIEDLWQVNQTFSISGIGDQSTDMYMRGNPQPHFRISGGTYQHNG
jgi:hypothetical protein